VKLSVCSFPGCLGAHQARGYCSAHYRQLRKGVELYAFEPRINQRKRARPCSVDFCDDNAKSLGLCNAHYFQQRAGKPFSRVRVRRQPRHTDEVARRDEQGRKRCLVCAEWRIVENFAVSNASKDGRFPACRSCSRDRHLARRYRISSAEADALLASQGGACAICREPIDAWTSDVHIDHDHTCCPGQSTCGGCVRGVLCAPCNHGIGRFRDNPQLLRAAIDYLTPIIPDPPLPEEATP
jgi:hypothetical protein